MNRPPLEVADIVRCAGQSFIERSRKWINGQHEKVLLAITRCRTAALGGHRELKQEPNLSTAPQRKSPRTATEIPQQETDLEMNVNAQQSLNLRG